MFKVTNGSRASVDLFNFGFDNRHRANLALRRRKGEGSGRFGKSLRQMKVADS